MKRAPEIRCGKKKKKKGKMAINEWKNNDSEILWALDSVCNKIRVILFLYLVVNLFKQGYISSVKS